MDEILDAIIDFRNKRGWHITDNPESLAKSIIIEAAELLENFQWGEVSKDEENIKEELADVLIYALAFALDQGYDVKEIIEDKLKKNAIKYPE
jgi:NTP pyrophosphatase (non-canonical NTP hydrolase)